MQRPQLHKELDNIHNELIKMGALVEEAIRMSTDSLKNKDIKLAEQVIKNDDLINELELFIEERCMIFIARQHPLAMDLRDILIISKLITDLERIGDHCEDIAKATLRLKGDAYIKELIDIPKMSDLASKMVTKALDAFVNRDAVAAREIYEMDNKIDELYKGIFSELLELMAEDNSKTFQSTTFLFVASHLERIGDYAKNICEKAVFIVEGNYNMK